MTEDARSHSGRDDVSLTSHLEAADPEALLAPGREHRRTRFSASRMGDVATLTVDGEFDLHAVADFHRARERALGFGLPLVIDLTDCDFMDSTAIGGIVSTFNAAERAGLTCALVGVGPQVENLLARVGAAELLPRFDSIDDARTHARGEA